MNQYIYRYLTSWCELFDGLVGVLTFGLIIPDTSFRLALYQSKRLCENSMKEEKNGNA